MSALPPASAIALAVRLIEERGFTVVARNARGDSVYLAQAGRAGQLRVSNHARTPRQRRGRHTVLTSLVVREPRSAAQVKALVAAALRNFEGAARTLG